MKILVTGSSGLVGTALVSALARAGHTVCRLVRAQSAASTGAKEGFVVSWNPATGELGGAGVGADAVVNLAGASIADGRWTTRRKALLRSSRIDTTRALVNALAKMNARPSVLVSASAIGIYGDRGDETLTEVSKPGTDFLAALAKEWEAEALKAEALGIRVVLARFGIILAREGGALPKMMLPFKFGAGGKLASGKQWMSWVMLEDVVAMSPHSVAPLILCRHNRCKTRSSQGCWRKYCTARRSSLPQRLRCGWRWVKWRTRCCYPASASCPMH